MGKCSRVASSMDSVDKLFYTLSYMFKPLDTRMCLVVSAEMALEASSIQDLSYFI